MKAESYQFTEVVEAADLIRAALCDAHGRLDSGKNWESSAASWCKSLWLTDCKSAEATLHKPVTKGIDKRLGIELASLRQYLWRRRFQHLPDKRLLEELPDDEERTDLCRWIDTTVMACDCLTKDMSEEYLQQIIESNIWNIAQTEEAKAVKLRKSAGVQRRKAERAQQANDQEDCPSGDDVVSNLVHLGLQGTGKREHQDSSDDDSIGRRFRSCHNFGSVTSINDFV